MACRHKFVEELGGFKWLLLLLGCMRQEWSLPCLRISVSADWMLCVGIHKAKFVFLLPQEHPRAFWHAARPCKEISMCQKLHQSRNSHNPQFTCTLSLPEQPMLLLQGPLIQQFHHFQCRCPPLLEYPRTPLSAILISGQEQRCSHFLPSAMFFTSYPLLPSFIAAARLGPTFFSSFHPRRGISWKM